jgi:mannosyltransferase
MDGMRIFARTTPRHLPYKGTILGLFLIMMSASWFRCHNLDSKSLWLDEGVTAGIISLDRSNFINILWHREANMSLYFTLLRAWNQLGGSVAMLRSFSVLASLATIPAIYVLGRKLFSNAVGLAAALLLAFNAYSIRYAQEARSYSLVTFFVTLSTYYLVRALDTGRKRDWFLYIAASVSAIYSHFFAVLVVVAHGFALTLWPHLRPGAAITPQKATARFWKSALCITLCCLPLCVFVLVVGPRPILWIKPPTLRTVLQLLLDLSGNSGGGSLSGFSEYSWSNIVTLWLCPLYLVLAILGIQRSPSGIELDSGRWSRRLLLCWLVVPIAISLAFSLIQPVFFIRYLIICLPALVLLVAVGAMSFRHTWQQLTALLVTCLLAMGGTRAYYEKDFDIKREDYRGASEYVLAHAEPNDMVLFYRSYGRFPFTYYADHAHNGTAPSIIYPGTNSKTWRDFMTPLGPSVLTELAQSHKRVWLFLSRNTDGLEEDEITAALRESASSRRILLTVREYESVTVYLYAPVEEASFPKE